MMIEVQAIPRLVDSLRLADAIDYTAMCPHCGRFLLVRLLQGEEIIAERSVCSCWLGYRIEAGKLFFQLLVAHAACTGSTE